MRTRLVLGLVAAAALVAGIVLSRARLQPPAAGPEPRAPLANEADLLPDVTHADAEAAAGSVRLVVSLAPRPLAALRPFRVRVQARLRGAPVPLEQATIRFDMAMPMGVNRYTLEAEADGWLAATVTLPTCVSRQSRWYATIEGTVEKQPVTARLRFDVIVP
jgi:hypothetical protein